MSKRLLRRLLLLALLPLVTLTGCVHNYQKDISKRLQALYAPPSHHKPLNGYVYAALLPPVGTLFCKDAANKWPLVPDAGCEFTDTNSYFIASLSDTQKQQLLTSLIQTLNGGAPDLSDDVKLSAKFAASMPVVGSLGPLSANADLEKHLTVSISGDSVVMRILKFDSLHDDACSQNLTPTLIQHLKSGDFIIASSDIQISNYKATVSLDQSANATANTTLQNAMTKLSSSNQTVSVDVSAAQSGTYTVTSKDPVTVAALYVIPPPGEVGFDCSHHFVLSQEKLKAWRTVKFQSPNAVVPIK